MIYEKAEMFLWFLCIRFICLWSSCISNILVLYGVLQAILNEFDGNGNNEIVFGSIETFYNAFDLVTRYKTSLRVLI